MNVLNEALLKLKRLEGEIERLKTIEKGGGITDHGALSGLDDDDHPQYAKLSEVYPVGAVYISVSATSPATLFGGTWQSFGAGRVLVGIDTADANFDTIEETGGEKTHTLTAAEMPSHTHDGNTGTEQGYSSSYGVGYVHTGSKGLTSGSVDILSTAAGYTHTHPFTTNGAGGGGAHNNLQPYIVVYMWKRTA